MLLPRPHLSFSALSLWAKDRNKFRRRYYENIKEPDTVFTLYGREIHDQIGTDQRYQHIRLPVAEQRIMVMVGQVPVLGYVDTFDPQTCAFKEYKTGIAKPDGSPRWTAIDVAKHEQLPFYSFLIQKKYGEKVNQTSLIWFETKFEENDRKIGSVVLGSQKRLRLTGKYEVFDRRLYQYERDWIKKWITRLAKEISEDYQQWQKKQNIPVSASTCA